MDLQKVKKVYCIGIGGIGVSGLARIFKAQGKQVSGSDAVGSKLLGDLVKEGLEVFIGHKPEQVPRDADLYVYTAAAREDNPERLKIKELGLQAKELSYFEAVGELMKEYEYSIAVSGTHGKTTTTAMLALAMQKANLDPTVIVGSQVKQFNGNARLGQNKKYFVIEACEYREHMLKLNPKVIILTNIEEDHLDYYRDLEHIEMSFQNYINKLPADGLLVKNEDDSESRNLGYDGKILSYGIDQSADIMAKEIIIEEQKQSFKVGKYRYTLKIPGKFNIYNALAVIAFLHKVLGVKEEVLQKAMEEYSGTWRRFEVLGQYRGATVISDYAHHPTAVKGLIKAAKEFYPGRRIFIIFQPHQHSRTQKLFDQFCAAFSEADFIIFEEIFDVIGREAGSENKISSQDLKRVIEQQGKYVFYSAVRQKTRELLDEHLERNDVLLLVGAGDIYLLGEDLIQSKK